MGEAVERFQTASRMTAPTRFLAAVFVFCRPAAAANLEHLKALFPDCR